MNPASRRPPEVKTLSPAQSLLFLALAGLAVGGWLYGLHWKRVASGDLFSSDERLMIRLQDQIETLVAENERLREQANPDEDAADAPEPPPEAPPGLLPAAPELPAPPQKIETH